MVPPTIKLSEYLEVLWAATLTHRVESEFTSTGGMMIVAPPGALKTTMLDILSRRPGCLALTDITTTGLVRLRDLAASGKLHNLMLLDFQKVYERRKETADNIIGSIRALMDEGFTSAAFETSTPIQTVARCMILAACTPELYRQKLKEWQESGFERRCVFSVYNLDNPDAIPLSIMSGQKMTFEGVEEPLIPLGLRIKMVEQKHDKEILCGMLYGGMMDDKVPLILLRKILAVLRWKYSQYPYTKYKHNIPIELMAKFGLSMRSPGVNLSLTNAKQPTKARERPLKK